MTPEGNFRDLTLIHGVHFAAEAWSGHLLVDDDDDFGR